MGKGSKNGKNEREVGIVNKSDIMRRMYDEGKLVNEISKELGVHYSFCYGVIDRYCKDTGREMRKVKRESKSDIIRSMVDRGMTVGEISKELNSNYSFVFSVVKRYREELRKGNK